MAELLTTPLLAGLATIPEHGPAPEQRIKSATDARKLSDGLKQEDLGPAYTRSLVNGLVGGALPFTNVPPDLAFIPNINFMEGAAMIETSRVPYYQLLNVENYAEVKVTHDPDNPDREKWQGYIQTFFHEMINRWGLEWFWEFQRKDYEMLKHGIGPIMFEDYPNWRFRSLDAGALKVPKSSPSCLNKRIPYSAIYHNERVHTLWEKIKDADAASKVGANVTNIRSAIMYAMKGANTLQSWDYYERILDARDLSASFSDGDIVPCVTILNKEFSGKVSRLTFTEASFSTPDERDNNLTEDSGGFLYSAIGKYDDYAQCVIVFFHELGDRGTWESVKGLGAKAFRHLTVSNQQKCRMLAAVEMSTGLTIQIGDTRSKDAMQLIQRGMVTYIPPGVKVIQQPQQAGFLDGPITVDRVLSNHLANNLGQFNPRNISREDGKGEMPTATQVNNQVAKEASLSQGQISLHYTTLDAMFSEMFRRATMKGTTDEEAKRFQKQCTDAQVPKEALQNCIVRTNRISGYGSAQMRQLSDDQMLKSGAVAAMSPQGQQNFWRYYTGGVKGADKIESFFPIEQLPNRDDVDAEMENGLIASGRTPVLYGNDVVHVQSHLGDTARTLAPVEQAIQQGQNDPEQLQKAIEYLGIMGPHLEAHIGRMQSDPHRKQDAKLFQDKLNQLVAFNGKLHGAVRDAQRQQSINQQEQARATSLGALDQAKVRSAQADDQIKAMKAKSDIQRKDAKTANDLRLKTISTLHTLGLKSKEAKAETLNGASNGR